VRLRTAIAAADGVLIATREYNGSIPGVLKNARDWGSRPFPDNEFRDKPVIVMDDSAGLFAAAWAKADLRASRTSRHLGRHRPAQRRLSRR
jgi:chromate reductase